MKTKTMRISKRAVALIMGILMLFSVMLVGNISTANAVGATGGKLLKGDKIYYDFSKTNATEANYLVGTDWCFSKLPTNKIVYGVLNADMDFNNPNSLTNNIAQYYDGNSWGHMILKNSITAPANGQNMIIYNADGNGYTWGTYNGSSSGGSSVWVIHFNHGDGNWVDYNMTLVSGTTYSGTVTGLEANTTYLFGINDTTSDSTYYKNVDITEDNNTATMPNNTGDNATIETGEAGDYTFTFDTSTGRLEVTYPASTQASSWGVWGAVGGSSGTWKLYPFTGDDNTVSISLKANSTFVFGVKELDSNNKQLSWWSASTTQTWTASVDNFQMVKEGGKNITVRTADAGNYTFTFDPSTKQISVAFPNLVKYSITSSTGDHVTSVTATPNPAAAGKKVEAEVRFESGYQMNTFSVKAGGSAIDATRSGNIITFNMPATDVVIEVTAKEREFSNNTYYILGDKVGLNWTEGLPMNCSNDGLYEYYEVPANSGALEFYMADFPTEDEGGDDYSTYQSSLISNGFNETNVNLTANGDKCVLANNTAKTYIIIYYPDTDVNQDKVNPKICASTTLPQGINRWVKAYIKDGTILEDGNPGVFATNSVSTVSGSESGIRNIVKPEGKDYYTAEVRVGSTIHVETTVNDVTVNGINFSDTYYVKGYNVNGETFGFRSENTVCAPNADNTRTYSADITVTADLFDNIIRKDDTNKDFLEITPVYFHDQSSNDEEYVTFYVENFKEDVYKDDGTIKEYGAATTWGNTIACYTYYYTGNDNDAETSLGLYPGQPFLKGEGDRYYVQVPLKYKGYNISGMTINNYQNDAVHREINSGLAPRQTYDYNDFIRIVEENEDVSNIVFYMRYNQSKPNTPHSAADTINFATLKAIGAGDYIDRKAYNQVDLTNVFGETTDDIRGYEGLESATIDKTDDNALWIISHGYDDADLGSAAFGEFPTSWYFYEKTGDDEYTRVNVTVKGKVYNAFPSSLFKYSKESIEDDRLKTLLGDTDVAEAFKQMYLKLYDDYRAHSVRISYASERQNKDENGNLSGAYRSDGQWYFVKEGQQIEGNIKIQYEDRFNRGKYLDDAWNSKGKGTVTGADAYFTNAESDNDTLSNFGHTFTTTVRNSETYNFQAGLSSGPYEFIGWYVSDDGGETISSDPISKKQSASSQRDRSRIFIARYKYVETNIKVTINYTFEEYNGDVVYEDDAPTVSHTLVKNSTIGASKIATDALAVANTTKLAQDLAPIIQSDYYDYELDLDSISYEYDKAAKKVEITAPFTESAHLYSLTVRGNNGTEKVIKGYYNWRADTLDSKDYLTESSDEAYWYLSSQLSKDNEILYADTIGIDNYRFVTDGAVLTCKPERKAGDSVDTALGSVIINSYYERWSEQDGAVTDGKLKDKITQNFYIVNYIDESDKFFMGSGICYFVGDENGNPVNTTIQACKDAIIDSDIDAEVSNLTPSSVKNGNKTVAQYVYRSYMDTNENGNQHFMVSDYPYAFQNIFGITLTNNAANEGKTLCSVSFMIYETDPGVYEYKFSDTVSVAKAYVE